MDAEDELQIIQLLGHGIGKYDIAFIYERDFYKIVFPLVIWFA